MSDIQPILNKLDELENTKDAIANVIEVGGGTIPEGTTFREYIDILQNLFPPYTPQQLFENSEEGGYSLSPNSDSYFTDDAGTTSAVLTDSIGFVADESGNGVNWVQATEVDKPVWAQENGVDYLSFNLSNTSLSTTLAADTYTIIIPTRQGIWIDSVDHAGGVFSIGPTSYTGGPAGILSALESDGVAKLIAPPLVINRPLSSAEKVAVIRWYQRRGAELFEMPNSSTLSLDFLSEEFYAVNKDNGFLTAAGFDNIISFTRASGGGRFNHLGIYEWVGNNVPRIDHDPATVDTSTSSVVIGAGLKTFDVSRLYPVGQYVRATADASNWVSGRVVESTGSSVTLWVDRVVGTGTHASWTLIRVLGLLVEESRTNLLLNSATLSTQSVTVTATAHTLAFYGTGTVTLSGAATGTLVGTGANNRVVLTFTPTAGSLTLTVSGSVTSAGLQAGAFITSYIPTTSSQVTREADAATVNTLSPWYRADEGTLVVNSQISAVSSNANTTAALTDNTINNRMLVGQYFTTTRLFNVAVGGVDVAILEVPAVPVNVTHAFAGAYKQDAFRACVDGGSVMSDTSGGVPVVSRLHVGALIGSAQVLNGHISSINYCPRALTNTELQAITS